ncbi:hypothetical protein PPYR_01570, partial [Photinus pyralis]
MTTSVIQNNPNWYPAIFLRVCTAIFRNLKQQYLQQSKWNFPLCLGSIDRKYINFRAPRSAGSYFYNYKGDHSIVLLAVADANYKFLYVDVGVNGRVSDGGVYSESSLKLAIDRGKLNLPTDECLPDQDIPIPYTFIADDAFPLSKRIMKPFNNRGLTNDKRILNYRLSRARRVVENAFGILANRFRILLNTINLSPDKVELITLTCCVLHNFLLSKNPKYKKIAINNNKLPNLVQIQG